MGLTLRWYLAADLPTISFLNPLGFGLEFRTFKWVWSSGVLLRRGDQSFACRWLRLVSRVSAYKSWWSSLVFSLSHFKVSLEHKFFWVHQFFKESVMVLSYVLYSPFITTFIFCRCCLVVVFISNPSAFTVWRLSNYLAMFETSILAQLRC